MSLPLELKHHITELSSPKSLAALAQTHTTYQRVAEQALYKTLSLPIRTHNDDSLKCLETLAENPEKAAFVRFLTIEFAPNNADKNRRTMTYMLKGLINMHSLSDFRVRMRSGEIKGWAIMAFYNILSKGHFRLQTLYCNDNLDIFRIIKSQPELQVLGLYGSCSETHGLLKQLRKSHNAQSFLPIIFTLKCDSYLPGFNHVRVFPAFYSVEQCATIHQVLTQSLSSDRLVNVEEVSDLSIYLTYSSDMPTIYTLAKNMVVSFPKIDRRLSFWLERPLEISFQEEQKNFSFFSDLCGHSFYYWPGYYGNPYDDGQQTMSRQLRPRMGREVKQGLYKT